MSTNVRLDGFQDTRYFSRAWALLTKDSGWIKPVVILILIQLIPIVGSIMFLGYALEWARVIAWDNNSSPKQSNIDWGGCLSSGWKAFVVFLGWSLAASLAARIIVEIPFIGYMLAPVASLAMLFVSIAAAAAGLRSVIYQNIKAGYQVDRLGEMIGHDWKGLLKIAGILLVGGVILSVVGVIIFIVVFGANFGAIREIVNNATTEEEILSNFGFWVIFFLQAVALIAIITLPLTTILYLLEYAAIGLWFRQFNVQQWGASEDPLPPFRQAIDPYAAAVASQVYEVPQTGYQQQTYQPQAYQAQTYQPVESSYQTQNVAVAQDVPVQEPTVVSPESVVAESVSESTPSGAEVIETVSLTDETPKTEGNSATEDNPASE